MPLSGGFFISHRSIFGYFICTFALLKSVCYEYHGEIK